MFSFLLPLLNKVIEVKKHWLSRWFVFLLGAVEVVSYLARRYMDKKTKRG